MSAYRTAGALCAPAALLPLENGAGVAGPAWSTYRRGVLHAAVVPQGIEATFDLQLAAGADVSIEDLAIVTDLLDDLHRPVLRQLQILAIFPLHTQQAGDVRVLAALGLFFDVCRSDAQFLGVEHGEQGPTHDIEPFLIALADRRAEGLLGSPFGLPY